MPDPLPAIVHGFPADPAAALDLLSQGWHEPERSLQREGLARALAGGAGDDLVCVRAVEGERLAGVALAQILPGRTAAVFPPQASSANQGDLMASLLSGLEGALTTRHVQLAQALLALDQVEVEQCFLNAGFARCATLLYMVSDPLAFPAAPPALDVNLEPVTPDRHQRLARVIEETYQGTLDSPLLNGLRSPEDVLAGYRGVGTHRPELWLLVRYGNEDVGCLLLADHLELGNLELVYLGLVPAARGKGLGLALTRHALWLAGSLSRQRVVLAVDAANQPAISIYERAGFFGFDQRIVLIKPL